jgi:hypothetical protein
MTLSTGCDITLLPYSIWGGFSAMAATVRTLFSSGKSKTDQNRNKNGSFME